MKECLALNHTYSAGIVTLDLEQTLEVLLSLAS